MVCVDELASVKRVWRQLVLVCSRERESKRGEEKVVSVKKGMLQVNRDVMVSIVGSRREREPELSRYCGRYLRRKVGSGPGGTS
jgi:hypothetical protein